MTKASLPILPFPAEIERRDFGHYLSGFTDGEGCFGLNLHTYNYSPAVRPCAAFTINLRADDLAILRLIQSFFSCGILTHGTFNTTKSKDQYVFKVTNLSDLVSVVIPHFEAFPLRAKKARDFVVWREGVQYIHAVVLSRRGGLRGRPRGRKGPQRWTPDRVDHYLAIRARLKAGRVYNAPTPPPSPPPPAPEPTLFDYPDSANGWGD